MFTRCPNCQSVHALNASLIAHASGRVRCGNCNQDFSVLGRLFDHWPDSDTPLPTRVPHAGPPVLGGENQPQEIAGHPDPFPGDEALPSPELPVKQPSPGMSSRNWVLILCTLLIATAINFAWTFREPLLANPLVRSWLTGLGILEQKAAAPFRDISRLHLVSRDLHHHPTRAGMLALSVTFVNRAQRAQPYPNIELILRDGANQPLARREFLPSEYLPGTADITTGLGPNIHVPVLLEFADPGSSATGFEINFR